MLRVRYACYASRVRVPGREGEGEGERGRGGLAPPNAPLGFSLRQEFWVDITFARHFKLYESEVIADDMCGGIMLGSEVWERLRAHSSHFRPYATSRVCISMHVLERTPCPCQVTLGRCVRALFPHTVPSTLQ